LHLFLHFVLDVILYRKFVGRTVVITGASRGIGKEIALKLAKDGANIVIAAKTATAHPKLPGTIYSAAEEVEKAVSAPLGARCPTEASTEKLTRIETTIWTSAMEMLSDGAGASGSRKAAVEEDIASVLANMKGKLSKDLVDKMQAVFEFTLTGNNPTSKEISKQNNELLAGKKERKIVIDLKNGDGSVAENGDENADVK
ncbi:hypothetical protein TELCIR_18639, partial [Teladorsagia circumcincta]